jgi:hypothetical protein
MDDIDTGLAIAPLCIVVVFTAWIIYDSCQKKREIAVENEKLIMENEIV